MIIIQDTEYSTNINDTKTTANGLVILLLGNQLKSQPTNANPQELLVELSRSVAVLFRTIEYPFDEDGHVVNEFGRRGQWPWEIQMVNNLFLTETSLYNVDNREV